MRLDGGSFTQSPGEIGYVALSDRRQSPRADAARLAMSICAGISSAHHVSLWMALDILSAIAEMVKWWPERDPWNFAKNESPKNLFRDRAGEIHGN